MTALRNDKVRRAVQDNYAKTATAAQTGCGCSSSSCGTVTTPEDVSMALGYTQDDVSSVPKGSNLGLGCGNPQAIASLQVGETVLDLGSGAGFDCFLAARAVERNGRVIGVDMTPEMVSKARANAEKAGLDNVTFRLGEIENLPVADNTVDVIISNCVINLSPEKEAVFREAFRVLKPGGRLAVSDIVAILELPPEMKQDLALYTSCMSGASVIDDVEAMLNKAGFENVRIAPKDETRQLIRDWAPGRSMEDYVVSATIEAIKPKP